MFKEIRILLTAGIMILWAVISSAQRIGLLPPNVKWHEIHNDSLRIIFRTGEERLATRIASVMLKLAASDPINTKGRYKPISVILQTQTNISNGYVGLAPYVSEFYLQPFENPFSLGSLPWHDLLAIHEYRHVLQLNAANTGVSHTIKKFFGELAFSGMYALSVPNWFREGDAVMAESKWTEQGRGRLSSFTLPFREKLKEGTTWEYYKIRNGSYKYFTPDHYALGYLLIQYGNHVFGEQTWDTILQEAASFKNIFHPFSEPLLRHYGKRTKYFYEDAMKWYAQNWKDSQTDDIDYPAIALKKEDLQNDYFDMAYADVDEDGTIYTSIKTFDRTTAIYKIDSLGKKRKVQSVGLQQDPYFDHHNHRLVWTELRFDPRWIRKDKNVLVVFDERSGRKITIQPKKGFFTPSFGPKGRRIATLHVDEDDHYNIQIYDAKTGGLLGTLPNGDNLYLEYPIWDQDEISILAIARDRDGRMAIISQDIATGNITPITHFSFTILGKPFLHDQWIFLTTNLDTLDQVYAVDRTEGIFYRVTSGNFAHYDPAWDPTTGTIICSEYHLNGRKLVRVNGRPGKDWKLTGLDNGVKAMEGAVTDLLADVEKSSSYTISDYSMWKDAVNFHSLTLVADDPSWQAEVRSNNVLNNLSIAAGYEYNRNSKAGGPYADVRLGMFYPVISVGVDQSARRATNTAGQRFRISNDHIHAGLLLPLTYSVGPYQRIVNLSSTYHKGFSRIRPEIAGISDLSYNYISHRIVLINSRNMAYRQAMPSWAQRFDLSYSKVSGEPVKYLYMSTDFILPGIQPSHYFNVIGEYLSQKISANTILLSTPFAGARGYDQLNGTKEYRLGLTYGFPVWYPDFGLGSILYSRRVRLQPFYDVAYSDDKNARAKWMRSLGAEVIVDFQLPPFSIGLRYSKLLSGGNRQSNVFEFFIPVQRF